MLVSSSGYFPRLPQFEYLVPQSVEEAYSLLSQYPGRAKVIAGGTDLLVSMKKTNSGAPYLVNLKQIPELNYILSSEGEGVKIGSLTPLSAIVSSSVIKDGFELLAVACHKVGNPQVRNMGTLGGNICNAGPSQDSLPALLVLNAKLKLLSQRRERTVPIGEFFTGAFQTILQDTEILTEIEIPPLPARSATGYHWLTKATEVDETLVGVAVLMALDRASSVVKDIRIGLSSVAPIPFRAKSAEAILQNQEIDNIAIEKAAQAATDETNPRSRAAYRRQMTAVLVKRAVAECWQKLKGGVS
jgi:CO/xanthine dehydrogenase FAD-binding subunit